MFSLSVSKFPAKKLLELGFPCFQIPIYILKGVCVCIIIHFGPSEGYGEGNMFVIERKKVWEKVEKKVKKSQIQVGMKNEKNWDDF